MQQLFEGPGGYELVDERFICTAEVNVTFMTEKNFQSAIRKLNEEVGVAGQENLVLNRFFKKPLKLWSKQRNWRSVSALWKWAPSTEAITSDHFDVSHEFQEERRKCLECGSDLLYCQYVRM